MKCVARTLLGIGVILVFSCQATPISAGGPLPSGDAQAQAMFMDSLNRLALQPRVELRETIEGIRLLDVRYIRPNRMQYRQVLLVGAFNRDNQRIPAHYYHDSWTEVGGTSICTRVYLCPHRSWQHMGLTMRAMLLPEANDPGVNLFQTIPLRFVHYGIGSGSGSTTIRLTVTGLGEAWDICEVAVVAGIDDPCMSTDGLNWPYRGVLTVRRSDGLPLSYVATLAVINAPVETIQHAYFHYHRTFRIQLSTARAAHRR